MKIGIVTQPLKANYGGILQNWALQQTLIKMGHEPITIDYLPAENWSVYVKVNVARLLQSLKTFSGYKYFPKSTQRPRLFSRFVCDHIFKTKIVHSYSDKQLSEHNLDAIIVGSDQVWRPRYNGDRLYNMFLDFVTSINIKKISYASSFGTDEWEFNEEQTKKCRNLLKRFDAVSVRESSGVDLCEKYLQHNAVQVLDPTLLLSKDDYMHLTETVRTCSKIPFLACYVLDMTDYKRAYASKKAKELGLRPLFFSGSEYAKYSVEEWISIFRDADYVITDSFHGSVFSMIFNKPFESMGNTTRGNARFQLIDTLKNHGDISDLRLKSLLWLENSLKSSICQK